MGPSSPAAHFKDTVKTLASKSVVPLLHILRAIGRSKGPMLKSSKGLKTRTYDGLKKHGAKWMDDIPCALWGNQTSLSQATRETPFFLAYKAEAVLPREVTMGSLRVQTYDEATQDQLWCDDIDPINELRW
jgi:hypothetical protein